MQPWDAFRPDGVIMFSDILTPLPALGIEFDVIRGKGPLIAEPITRCRALDPSTAIKRTLSDRNYRVDLRDPCPGKTLVKPKLLQY